MEKLDGCKECNLAYCPVVNKVECPVYKLWTRAREMDKSTIRLRAESTRLTNENN